MPTTRTTMVGPAGLGTGPPAIALNTARHWEAAAIGRLITVPGRTP